MSHKRLRLARCGDLPRIRDIRAAVRENRLSDPSRVTDADILWFVRASALLVWDEAGLILGFSAADPRDGTVWALFVDPSAEGRGIGQTLIEAACNVLLKANHVEATLSTDAGTRAERFYLRNGWAAEGYTARGETIFRKALGFRSDESA